jgi:flavin reductase
MAGTDKAFAVQDFWRAISSRAVGAAVVTSRDDNGPAGFLALSATHLCAAPPTLMVSVDGRTSALGAIRSSGCFAINYLPASARDLYDDFAGKTQRKGVERFVPEAWTTLSTGSPVLRSAVGAMDCRVEDMLERHGTHIVIGRLVDVMTNTDAQPLITFRGGFI